MTRKPTGKVERTRHGADLIITRSFRATIEDVWQSVTASESTARWIGSWEGEAGPGRTIRLKMLFEEGAPESDAKIERCDPPRHLALSMVDEQGTWNLELELREERDATEVVFVQHLTDPTLAGSTGPGWEYYLDRLVASREGAPMPDFSEYYPGQKAHFEAQIERK